MIVKGCEEFHCLVCEARRHQSSRDRLEIAHKNQELYCGISKKQACRKIMKIAKDLEPNRTLPTYIYIYISLPIRKKCRVFISLSDKLS